jgi:hypothetical protein
LQYGPSLTNSDSPPKIFLRIAFKKPPLDLVFTPVFDDMLAMAFVSAACPERRPANQLAFEARAARVGATAEADPSGAVEDSATILKRSEEKAGFCDRGSAVGTGHRRRLGAREAGLACVLPVG